VWPGTGPASIWAWQTWTWHPTALSSSDFVGVGVLAVRFLPIDGGRKWRSVAADISVDLDPRQFKLQRRNANEGVAPLATARPDANCARVRSQIQGFRLILQRRGEALLARRGFRTLGWRRCGLHPLPQVQVYLILLPHRSVRGRGRKKRGATTRPTRPDERAYDRELDCHQRPGR
jgi:hypothetical protein